MREEKIIVFTFEAAASRLRKKPNAVKQAIKRLRDKGLPLIIGDFHFVLVSSNAYVAFHKDETIEVIRDRLPEDSAKPSGVAKEQP